MNRISGNISFPDEKKRGIFMKCLFFLSLIESSEVVYLYNYFQSIRIYVFNLFHTFHYNYCTDYIVGGILPWKEKKPLGSRILQTNYHFIKIADKPEQVVTTLIIQCIEHNNIREWKSGIIPDKN